MPVVTKFVPYRIECSSIAEVPPVGRITGQSFLPMRWQGHAIIRPSWPPPTTPRVTFPISIFVLISEVAAPTFASTAFNAIECEAPCARGVNHVPLFPRPTVNPFFSVLCGLRYP
jgi:hypothetical protein